MTKAKEFWKNIKLLFKTKPLLAWGTVILVVTNLIGMTAWGYINSTSQEINSDPNPTDAVSPFPTISDNLPEPTIPRPETSISPTVTVKPAASNTPTSKPISPTPQPSAAPTTTNTPVPTASQTPVPTPTAQPSVTSFTYTLKPPGSFTPNAVGTVIGMVTKNQNGYWDFKISNGTFTNLLAGRNYQLWWCGNNCSSHESAKFTTDQNGQGLISDGTVNHSQTNDPVSRIAVWEIPPSGTLPNDPNSCFQSSINQTACLQSSSVF